MSNRDLLKQFADGAPLDEGALADLINAKLIRYIGKGQLMLTTAGRILLNVTPAPPGDSASCPDDDSYLPPNSCIRAPEYQLAQAALNASTRLNLDAPQHGYDHQAEERDPNGKHQHETGAKLDAGKVRLGLVLGAFSNALIEVGKVGTYGAQKYTDNGWLDVPKGKARYTDAMLRHIFAEANESHDPDTNLHHAAHAAWNALARLELILRKRGDE